MISATGNGQLDHCVHARCMYVAIAGKAGLARPAGVADVYRASSLASIARGVCSLATLPSSDSHGDLPSTMATRISYHIFISLSISYRGVAVPHVATFNPLSSFSTAIALLRDIRHIFGLL
jgi:hypothetical protein